MDIIGDLAGLGDTSETVEKRFTVSGMPRVRVSNVSGETRIRADQPGTVFVRARIRIRGMLGDRAKRILENVEVGMRQDGDEILIEPRLYQQERGWLDLFRGGGVVVDLDILTPRESQLEVTTVSGEVGVTGTRGPVEIRSASGEVSIEDVQGPLRLRSVSGDLGVSEHAGLLDANSVSGDLEVRRSRVRLGDIVTVSGDVGIEAVLSDPRQESRVRTVSGDVELSLAEGAFEIEQKTVSGDLDVDDDLRARVERPDRRDRRVAIGQGGARLRVKSVSGDLSLRRSGEPAQRADEATEETPPAAPEPPADAAKDVLARLARGEIGVDEAATALDAAKR